MGKEIVLQQWEGASNFMGLFDEQFTISDFSTAIVNAEIKSASTLESTKSAIKKAFQKEGEETKLVADVGEDISEALKNGEVRLETGKNGNVYGQLRCSNGQYGGKIPLKEELQEAGISSEELKLALQMETIKDQLQTLIEGIKEIEGKVTEAIQGQRNDRIGLFYSGLSLYLEAREIEDISLRKQMLALSIKSINDANHQMIQDIRMSMEYLMTEQYKAQRREMISNVKERLIIIHQCYDVVFRAAFLKAAIYQENNEIPAMLMAIDEYGRFVERMIVPYVGKLSELDSDSFLIEKSVWGRMAGTLNGCKEIRQKINSNDIFYVCLGENGEDE